MKVQELLQKVVMVNPVKKSDSSFSWADSQQKAEINNPNVRTLPRMEPPRGK